ncbi:MAG: alanine racemase, partial [Ornithinibacter sp.]|nr:alanine racemase [Ornithinibacter sp.]
MTAEDHWDGATTGLPTPLVAVDLDAFDANADDLLRRAGGLPVRVASKSLRCRALLDRVLGRPGFAGVMAYAVPEAVWLARE